MPTSAEKLLERIENRSARICIIGMDYVGLLLAAESKGVVRVLTVDGELPPGAKVR